MGNKTIGIIYLLITAIIWGGAFIAQLIGGSTVGTFTFIGYRCILGCATIYLMIIITNFYKYKKFVFFTEKESIRDTILNSFWCGIVLFLSMATQQIGVERTDVAKSGIIASLEVICVPILMFIIYKRKIRLVTWIFIIFAMIGIMILNAGSVSGLNIGDILVLISTILYSLTILQVPKYIKNIDPLKFSFFRFVAVFILSLIFSIIFERKLISLSNVKIALSSILFAGIMSSGVAYTFQILGQKYCNPVIATLIMSLEGVFAAILGWIILGQNLSMFQIIGIIITFISICIVEVFDSNENLI